MIHLDTHALVWWTSSPERLSVAAREAIDSSKAIGVSAIVFWEVSLLVRKGRLWLAQPIGDWSEQVLAIPRLHALPLTAEIALAADALEMHPDPADRFIAATALGASARLVSKDGLLRSISQLEVVW